MGVGLGLIVLASLFLWQPAFLGVIAVAAGVGIWEMARALRVTGAHPPLIPLLAGGVLMTGLAWFAGDGRGGPRAGGHRAGRDRCGGWPTGRGSSARTSPRAC